MVRYFKGSSGICITTPLLPLPDQPPGESETEKGKISEVVKDKKRECRHSEEGAGPR